MQRALLQLGRFDHAQVFDRLQQTVFESGRMQAYCIDDTGVAKMGHVSVGVNRQSSETLGKVGNCQVIVSLHGVSDSFGACLGLRLYVPESWCGDTDRRALAKVPKQLKMRWHVERDYQDMKQELGFDRCEGRSWGGLHTHLAMVALMHAFISLHLHDFSPSGLSAEMDLERVS